MALSRQAFTSLVSLSADLLQLVVATSHDPTIFCAVRLTCQLARDYLDSSDSVFVALLSRACGTFLKSKPKWTTDAKMMFQRWYQFDVRWYETGLQLQRTQPAQLRQDLPARFLHRAEVCGPKKQQICVFGGRGKDNSCSNEVWLIDPVQSTVLMVPQRMEVPSLPAPSPRSSVTLTAWQDVLLVFGGLTNQDEYCSELWQLRFVGTGTDIVAEWTHIVPPQSEDETEDLTLQWPRGRWGHTMSATCDSGHLVLFGGSAPGVCFDDLWVLDAHKFSWEQLAPSAGEPAAAGQSLFNRGLGADMTWPAGRAGHSCEVVSDSVIMFGGNTTTECFNDLWRLPIASVLGKQPKWERIEYTGQAPSARIGHGAQCIGDRVFIIGGRNNIDPTQNSGEEQVFILETENWHWRAVNLPAVDDTSRSGRTGHCIVRFAPFGLFCFGGMQIQKPHRLLSDAAMFDFLGVTEAGSSNVEAGVGNVTGGEFGIGAAAEDCTDISDTLSASLDSL